MKSLLKKLGYEIDVAINGRVAVSLLENKSFDLILMDLQMPIMNGFEATQYIRKNAGKLKNSDVPIVAVTANAVIGCREECLSVGMDDYVTKPVNKNIVVNILDKWLPR